jgi:hypothetical protein
MIMMMMIIIMPVTNLLELLGALDDRVLERRRQARQRTTPDPRGLLTRRPARGRVLM